VTTDRSTVETEPQGCRPGPLLSLNQITPVPVREAPTASVLTRSRPTESHRNRRQVCWQCGGTGPLRRESLGGRNQGAEHTNIVTRGCTGTKGGRPAACDLPDSANGRRRRSRTSRTCSLKEGAAGQRQSESSPEASDHSYRVQRHLRSKMMVVHVSRLAPYLEATQDEQPSGGSNVTCMRFPWQRNVSTAT
jgi:hypothetical protein